MFGYITVNKSELKFREFDAYHSYYCGLCQSLLSRYGVMGQMTLSYDMTFVAMLLCSLYEPKSTVKRCGCIVHPFERHESVSNEMIDYIADMNVMLTLYKCEDDWNDDRHFPKACFGCMLRKMSCRKRKVYRKKENQIKDILDRINSLEKEECRDIDLISGLFGDIMSKVIVFRNDEWSGVLGKLGYYLGKYIYILDAYDDVERDIKRGKYNPLKDRYRRVGFDEDIRVILSMMMSECCKQFEMLPLLENVEILRNILYSGVWGKFEEVRIKRTSGNTQKEKGR